MPRIAGTQKIAKENQGDTFIPILLPCMRVFCGANSSAYECRAVCIVIISTERKVKFGGDKMLIESETMVLPNGEKITIRSAAAEDALSLCSHRYITSAETYFMARYPEECVFDLDELKKRLSDTKNSPRDFMVTAFLDNVIIGDLGVAQLRNHMKYRHRAYMGINIAAWESAVPWLRML